DRISVVEPWVTLVFMAIGVAALLLRDQRRVASLAVLRAESQATALHRRAAMLLALRDQLNTPLQTLVLGATRLALHEPTHDAARLATALHRLVGLSRELANVDLSSEWETASVRRDELGRTARRLVERRPVRR
ncbi:MAG: uncharacterized protein JWM53_6400, partial [bacterium]|nr:uncharacterized protein [bacterium]